MPTSEDFATLAEELHKIDWLISQALLIRDFEMLVQAASVLSDIRHKPDWWARLAAQEELDGRANRTALTPGADEFAALAAKLREMGNTLIELTNEDDPARLLVNSIHAAAAKPTFWAMEAEKKEAAAVAAAAIVKARAD